MPGPIWLQGPIADVPALLQPVAHALIEADEDIRTLLASLPPEHLWMKRHDAASVGYHVLHAAGSIDRLLTYARGEMLSESQLAQHAAEKVMATEGTKATPQEAASMFSAAVEKALAQLRATSDTELLAPRAVGRARAPSDLNGVLHHVALHTYRHVGQAITTAKQLKG